MTDIKRHYDDLLEGSQSPTTELSSDGKRQVKPGRKPIDSEPKSKRTAQNRAAQRAYRERKEKKMKDLEDKVKLLEDENSKINTETDLLRAQINLLKSELVKYKGSAVELNLPTTVGKLSHPESSNSLNSKSYSDYSDSRSSHSSLNDSSPDTDVSDGLLKTEFPWSKDNLQLGLYKTDDNSNKNIFMDNDFKELSNNNVPDLISGSSSSTSPLNDNILLDNNNKYEEQMDPFCEKLNESCVNKDQLLGREQAKKSNSSFKSATTTSPFGFYNNDQIFNDTFNFNLTPNDDNDPLSFLNDNNFDVNLVFDDNTEKVNPIESLVTEESVYDPLKEDTNSNFNFNDFIKSSITSETTPANSNPGKLLTEGENDDEVVPAPEKTFKCSEIWDRITSHPRYTEIDIDGLCVELKTKAKCSERGVVVNASDVNAILEQSAKRR